MTKLFVGPLVATLITTAAPAVAHGWSWYEVEPLNQRPGWKASMGTADVTFRGNHFVATLKDKDFAAYRVEGTIDGVRAKATEIKLNTDEAPLKCMGFVEHLRTPTSAPSRGWGSDRIVLSSGPWLIGLYRDTSTTP